MISETIVMGILKIVKWAFLSFLLFLLLWSVGRFLFCGPDKSILKITDPLAKEIVAYINEHGRPESLADIPNLSYKVEGCREDKPYIQKNLQTTEIEHCSFMVENEKFTIDISHITLYTSKEYSFSIKIRSEDLNTYAYYYFEKDKKSNKLAQKRFRIRYIKVPFLCDRYYLRLTQ